MISKPSIASSPPAQPALPQRNLRTLPQAVEERPFLTIRWLRNLIYERGIPSYRLGGRVLVDLDELDACVERRSA